ncbi:MAG: hypothetical protein EXS16_18135 [Gemmataceae bacterium]|nr:hypothetical protein [Gemmataceae bacterium]
MDIVSAGGKHLGRFPSAKVLDAFRKLPETDRKPNAGVIADLKSGESIIPEPPKNGLVLKVHTRALARDERGNYRNVTIDDYPLKKGNTKVFDEHRHLFGPNTDYMWITEAEWRGLVAGPFAKGEKHEVSKAIAERLALFHLMPRRLTSEGASWGKSQLKTAKLTLTVDDVSETKVRLRAVGFAHLGSTYDASNATSPNGPLAFGYEAPLHGIVEYDRKKDAITRFELVALGDVWGRWGDANGKSQTVERAGRNPVPIAFELATGASPTERLAPGGNGSYVDNTGYFSISK